MSTHENNPFVGFEIFTKQLTDDEEHPHGEDSHLDDASNLERYGDVETDDDYEDSNDVDLQWGKVSDAAKGAVGAAQSGVSTAAKTAQAAGAKVGQTAQTAAKTGMQAAQTAGSQAAKTAQDAGAVAGQKIAGAFGKSHDEMMSSLDEAIGLIEKQVPEDWTGTEDEYWDWATYTPEGAKSLGAKDHEAYGDNCVGEDCVIHGTPFYEREEDPPFTEENRLYEEAYTEENRLRDEQAKKERLAYQRASHGHPNVPCAGEDCNDPLAPTNPLGRYIEPDYQGPLPSDSYVDIPARSNANTSVNKSHDEITSNPFVGFDTVIKQTEGDEEDYYGDPSVATSTLRGETSENLFDREEVDMDMDWDDPNLNAYQRAALQESTEEPEEEEYEAVPEDDDLAYLYESEEKSFAKMLGSVIDMIEKQSDNGRIPMPEATIRERRNVDIEGRKRDKKYKAMLNSLASEGKNPTPPSGWDAPNMSRKRLKEEFDEIE